MLLNALLDKLVEWLRGLLAPAPVLVPVPVPVREPARRRR